MPGILTGLIIAVHIIACIALMISILLQSGKGGGLAGAFGGGSSQTLFGGRGAAGFLSRATTVLAVIFFVTSLTLGVTSSRAGAGRSLIQEEARRRAAQGASQQPGTTPAPTQPSPTPGGAPASPGTPAPGAPSTSGSQAPPTGTTSPAPANPAGQTPATGGH